jgi:hypothetical protein
MLSIPKYLEETNIQHNVLRYQWDEWDDLPALEVIDERLVTRLNGLSQRAVLAYGCGTSEWLVYRFGALCDIRAPWNYLEAAWAMIISVRYCGYRSRGWQYYSQEEWGDGPVKGPIKDGLVSLDIAFRQLSSEYESDPSIMIATISTLLCHVMTDPVPYKKWSDQVLKRFESLYVRNSLDLLGDVVPRQAIDPAYDFHVEETEALINDFLANLNYRNNPFLSPPEGMLEHFDGEEDFKGRPYFFDIEEDRRTRLQTREHH